MYLALLITAVVTVPLTVVLLIKSMLIERDTERRFRRAVPRRE